MNGHFVKRYGVPLVLLALFLVFVVWLNQVEKVPLVSREGQTFEKGVVTEIIQDNIQPGGTRVGEQVVRVRMTSGELKGEEIVTTSSSGFLFGAPCVEGMRVVIMQSLAGDTVVSSVYSQDREFQVLAFAAIYLIILCIVGGWQGIKSSLSLVFTFASIIWVYLPMVYRGGSPFWSAVAVCAVTTVVSMWLLGGATMKTLVATAGTVAGVVLSGSFASAFSFATGVTGWNVSDIESLMTLWNTSGIQVGGLLFSGLLISSLGAMMDVGMSIASSRTEICAQSPGISRRELFQSGMRVGRDMMGTNSNTLILAFAGSSVSMLVLDYAYDLPWLQIINSNNIGIAIMEGLSGSFGVVLSVPATVALATVLYTLPQKNKPAAEAPAIQAE